MPSHHRYGLKITGARSREGILRVGVIASSPDPTVGGGWILLECLVLALDSIESHHAFIRLDRTLYKGSREGTGSERRTHVLLRYLRNNITPSRLGDWIARGGRHLVKRPSPGAHLLNEVEQWIRSCEIDIVWFLDPCAAVGPITAGLSTPFMTSVWDLEHRTRPYFPEVSVSGWD